MFKSTIPAAVAAALLAHAGIAAGAGDDDASPDARLIRSGEGFTEQRPDEIMDPSALREAEIDAETVPRRDKTAATQSLASTVFGDHWIYDATAELFHDHDGDGYYHYLRVRLDADSYYQHAWVYAALYLSGDGRDWELYAETEDFWIEGSTSLDEYEVETELVSGYPRGLYDVLIELYDADTGVLVDEFGPAESSALALLPIEDSYRDAAQPPVSSSAGHGGGGALTWLLAPLAVFAWRRRLHANASGAPRAGRPRAGRDNSCRGRRAAAP